MQTIGQKIKILIKAKGWDVKDFAAKADYNPSSFSRLINSDDISDKAIYKIAKTLGVAVETLTGPEEWGKGKMPEGFDKLEEQGIEYKPLVLDDATKKLVEEVAAMKAKLADLSDKLDQRGEMDKELLAIIKNLTAPKK